jgi:hypothetical protein
MERIAAWTVAVPEANARDATVQPPMRLASAKLELERHLEDWIVLDPELVGDGLTIVARQLVLENGGRLDLLALDPSDQLVVIEVKRDRLAAAALTQALTYTALLAEQPTAWLVDQIMRNADHQDLSPPDDLATRLQIADNTPRDVVSMVVGVGLDAGTEKVLDYLSGRFGVPLRAVSFQVFGSGAEVMLTREIAEVEQDDTGKPPGETHSITAVQALADQYGTGPDFAAIVTAASGQSLLYTRPWARSVMWAPAARKTRALFTVWPEAGATFRVYVGVSTFDEILGVPADRVLELLGTHGFTPSGDGWLRFDADRAEAFAGFIADVATEAEASDDAPTGTSQLYQQWWKQLLPDLKARYPGWTTASKAPADSWMTLPAGRTGVSLSISFTGRRPEDKRLRVELYLDPPGTSPQDNTNWIYDRLEQQRTEIDRAFGNPLQWEPLPKRRACRIAAYTPFTAGITDQERWPEMQAWALEQIGRLREAVIPALNALPPTSTTT